MWWVLVINQRKDIIRCEENRRSKAKGASRIGCLILIWEAGMYYIKFEDAWTRTSICSMLTGMACTLVLSVVCHC